MSDNTAILAGFTRELIATTNDVFEPRELHVFVRPDTDLDERFKAYDADECEWIVLNGWMLQFTDIEDQQNA